MAIIHTSRGSLIGFTALGLLLVTLIVPVNGMLSAAETATTKPLTSTTTTTTLPVTGCPSSLPTSPLTSASSAVWMNPSFRASHTAFQLADIVLTCEESIRRAPSQSGSTLSGYASYLPAELSLLGLRRVAGTHWQNVNMLLSDTAPYGNLSAIASNDFYRLGIPPITFEDGPSGLIDRASGPTGLNNPVRFPNEMVVASSMDPLVATAYGATLGAEASVFGYSGVQSPDLNIDRIPNWGRSMETFGESPVLAGLMGKAAVQGLLQNLPIALVKHLGTYGQESSRLSKNDVVSTSSLMNVYLRPFAIAMSDPVPAGHAVSVMCAYGAVNSVYACTNPAERAALSKMQMNGIIRTDLETGTISMATHLAQGVDMIKTADPLSTIATWARTPPSAAVIAKIHNASRNVLATMFRASLVGNETTTNALHYKLSSQNPLLPSAQQISDTALVNTIETRGAVLLKTSNGAGSLPLARSSPLALLTSSDLSGTCATLALSLKRHGYSATCVNYQDGLSAAPSLLADAALWPVAATGRPCPGGYSTCVVRKTSWVAPASGSYLLLSQSHGNTQVTVADVTSSTAVLVGNILGSYEATNSSSLIFTATAGHHYALTTTYSVAAGRPASIVVKSLSASLTSALAGSRGRVAIFLANDTAGEGLDRSSLSLPYGQDVAIAAVAALVPTSVLLFSTGPVTMPWITARYLKSVLELWNPTGTPSLDTVATALVPAYSALVTGASAPTGRLPITFPKTDGLSPMGLSSTTTSATGLFWPGSGNTSNLDLAPLSGGEIGYPWYASAKWPVLFPFGFGLTYGTAPVTEFSTGQHPSWCTPVTSNPCVNVTVKAGSGTSRTGSIALYVGIAQQTSLPPIQLGSVASYTCSGTCTVPVDLTTTSLGAWSDTSNSYQYVAGCYSFILASDEAAALALATAPHAAPSAVVSASYSLSRGWDSVLHPGGSCTG